MVSGGEVREIDRGWGRIKQQLASLDGAGVKVGVQSDAGTPDGSDTPIVEYAFYNEMGTRHIPERPFIRSTADEKRRAWNSIIDRVVAQMYRGTMQPRRALDMLGQQATRDIQQKITTLRDPPNAASTIAIKGSSNPLIDIGTLRNSIRHVVEGL